MVGNGTLFIVTRGRGHEGEPCLGVAVLRGTFTHTLPLARAWPIGSEGQTLSNTHTALGLWVLPPAGELRLLLPSPSICRAFGEIAWHCSHLRAVYTRGDVQISVQSIRQGH